MSECPEVEAMLDEFALGVLPGDRRAVVIAHLEVCPSCRALLDVLSEAADELLLAGPRSKPPAGFEDDVMARIDAARPRRPRRRRMAAVAAVAAAVLLVAGGVVAGTKIHGPDELRTVPLISTSGRHVGDFSAYADTPAWYFMRVNSALPSGTYRCVLDLDRGGTRMVGSLFVSEGQGAWGQRVRIAPRQVRTARLLDSAGTTVATASFH